MSPSNNRKKNAKGKPNLDKNQSQKGKISQGHLDTFGIAWAVFGAIILVAASIIFNEHKIASVSFIVCSLLIGSYLVYLYVQHRLDPDKNSGMPLYSL